MSTTNEQRLREALTACRRELLQVLVSVNDEKVHFDGDDFHEALRLADNALARQAPTPAVLPEPMAYMVTRKIRTNQDGRARYLHLNKKRAEEDFDSWKEAGGADPVLIPLYAAVSEPAAPVVARDALGALANINDLACFASEEDTSTQAAVLLQIGHIARVAIQGQA